MVILPNAELTVHARVHPEPRDAHGQPVAGTAPEVRGPYPGRAREAANGSWTLGVDPRCWRLWPGDEITDGTRTWIVGTAQLNTNAGDDSLDFIAVTAVLDPPLIP